MPTIPFVKLGVPWSAIFSTGHKSQLRCPSKGSENSSGIAGRDERSGTNQWCCHRCIPLAQLRSRTPGAAIHMTSQQPKNSKKRRLRAFNCMQFCLPSASIWHPPAHPSIAPCAGATCPQSSLRPFGRTWLKDHPPKGWSLKGGDT